jgi:hypothetical protein
MNLIHWLLTAAVLLSVSELAAAGGPYSASVATTSWAPSVEKGTLVLLKENDSLRVSCTTLDKQVSVMDLLVAAEIEEPEEAYCCNTFGSFEGFETRESDGHQEWWLKKSNFIVHIVSSRTKPKWSAGQEVENIIKGLAVK